MELVRILLSDLESQTERPAQVALVVQAGDAGDRPSLTTSIEHDFVTLRLTIMKNSTRNLCAARNMILDASSADVVVFMDDDVRIGRRAVQSVVDAFEARRDTSVITFKTAWTGDGSHLASYPSKEGRRGSIPSVAHVVSIEIAARVDALRVLGVRFDNRFGLGSAFATGEEFIFLVDVLGAGGEIWFVPFELAAHSWSASGRVLDADMMYAKGAMFRRAYGPAAGLIVGFFFVMRKAIQKRLNCTLLSAAVGVFAGWRAFGTTMKASN